MLISLKVLYKCVLFVVFVWQGAGTNDDTLIRVIVTRCEVDMIQIKQDYQRTYGKTLEAAIEVGK